MALPPPQAAPAGIEAAGPSRGGPCPGAVDVSGSWGWLADFFSYVAVGAGACSGGGDWLLLPQSSPAPRSWAAWIVGAGG